MGVYDQELERSGYGNIIGIDIDETSIGQCAQQVRTTSYIRCASEHLPFREGTFDAVIMIEVLEHVNNLEFTIAECRRVLKKESSLCITVPNRGFPFLTHGFHLGNRHFDNIFGIPLPFAPYLPMTILERIWNARCFRLRELERLLRNNGFRIEQSGFLMPAFDDCGFSARVPRRMRGAITTSIEFLDRNENAWMGLSIAMIAKKLPSIGEGTQRGALD
jgi:SAM-dependent methyltransferase